MNALQEIRMSVTRSFTAKCIYALIVFVIVYFLIPSRVDKQFTEESKRFYGNSILEVKAEKLLSEVEDHANRKAERTSPSDGVQYVDTYVDAPVAIDVMITLKNAKQNTPLQRKFYLTVSSMLEHSTIAMQFHIMGDADSQLIAEDLLRKATDNKPSAVNYSVAHYDVDAIEKTVHEIVEPMQKHFSHSPGAYFSDALFFLSIAIHRVMPKTVSKVIMLDADLKFMTDIRKLYSLFEEFVPTNIIGIARENQPVYRHAFWEYRSKNPGSRVGEPPPRGLTGFNSGVLLLDVERMRRSDIYNSVLDAAAGGGVGHLARAYNFKGHLGDQDFFTLLSLEHEDLFYTLPCGWNRQLCRWWHDKGYADVFESYFNCTEPVHIYHGNCNTPIP